METLRLLFALSVFVSSLAACSVLIFIGFLVLQCGVQDLDSYGDWCGAGAIHMAPYWGPVAFVLSAFSSVIAFRSSASQKAMTWTVCIVAGGLFTAMLS